MLFGEDFKKFVFPPYYEHKNFTKSNKLKGLKGAKTDQMVVRHMIGMIEAEGGAWWLIGMMADGLRFG